MNPYDDPTQIIDTRTRWEKLDYPLWYTVMTLEVILFAGEIALLLWLLH